VITQLRIAAVQPGHAQRAHPWERARQRARRIAPTIPGAPGLGCAQHTRSVLRLDPSCHPSALALFVLRDRPHEQSGLNPCLRHGEAYFLGGTGGRPGGPGGPAGPMIPAHKRRRGEGGIASQESVSMWCSRSRATPRFHAGACQPADERTRAGRTDWARDADRTRRATGATRIGRPSPVPRPPGQSRSALGAIQASRTSQSARPQLSRRTLRALRPRLAHQPGSPGLAVGPWYPIHPLGAHKALRASPAPGPHEPGRSNRAVGACGRSGQYRARTAVSRVHAAYRIWCTLYYNRRVLHTHTHRDTEQHRDTDRHRQAHTHMLDYNRHMQNGTHTRTHARTHTRTHAHAHKRNLCRAHPLRTWKTRGTVEAIFASLPIWPNRSHGTTLSHEPHGPRNSGQPRDSAFAFGARQRRLRR